MQKDRRAQLDTLMANIDGRTVGGGWSFDQCSNCCRTLLTEGATQWVTRCTCRDLLIAGSRQRPSLLPVAPILISS